MPAFAPLSEEYIRAALPIDNGTNLRVSHLSSGTLIELLDTSKICDSNLLLPAENLWSINTRWVLYLIFLLWCFLGVQIVADIFMQAIEIITSKERTITKNGVTLTLKVWNPTVANLSLMALGSSAPEILLSIIDTLQTLGGEPGELGASTIVGSAAFNLLAICAACVVSIPSPEVKTVEGTAVFATTAFASVWAYIWMLIVLSFNTPGEVQLWEAIVTMMQFVVLVLVCWQLDKRSTAKRAVAVTQKSDENAPLVPGARMSIVGHGDRLFIKDGAKAQYKKDGSLGGLMEALHENENPSRMMYRISAARKLFGGKRVLEDKVESNKVFPIHLEQDDTSSRIDFEQSLKSCMESCGTVDIDIVRIGNTSEQCSVCIRSKDGTAKQGKDFSAVDEVLVFQPGEESKKIQVDIIDNDKPEEDRRFIISLLEADSKEGGEVTVGVDEIEVTIIDDDSPGNIAFADELTSVEESSNCIVRVIREGGSLGTVSCSYKTVPGTAEEGKDYTPVEGQIIFEHHEVEKLIEIPILNDFRFEDDEDFFVELIASAECSLGNIQKVRVVIRADDKLKKLIDGVIQKIEQKKENMAAFFSRGYAQQFRDAVTVGGEGDDQPANLDYAMHFFGIFWKVLFASVPPPGMGGGWPCFIVALSYIGLLTFVVGEVATLFGCSVGLTPMQTAITFVALGTSLPDTFASIQVAKQARTADAAIGNITGSNAVNVFLGLGLPWIMGAVYGLETETTFRVTEGALARSVIVFSICATVCLATLVARRIFVGGELGGPMLSKNATGLFFLGLWFTYVGVSW